VFSTPVGQIRHVNGRVSVFMVICRRIHLNDLDSGERRQPGIQTDMLCFTIVSMHISLDSSRVRVNSISIQEEQ
jgi:hypothetical protein